MRRELLVPERLVACRRSLPSQRGIVESLLLSSEDADEPWGNAEMKCSSYPSPAQMDSNRVPSSRKQGATSRVKGPQTAPDAQPRATSVDSAWRKTYNLLHTMIGGDPFAGIGAADISGGTELYWKCWKS